MCRIGTVVRVCGIAAVRACVVCGIGAAERVCGTGVQVCVWD